MEPHENGKDDLETGNPTPKRDPRSRFRDIVGSVIQDGRREQMKKKLIAGLKSDDLEKYRKSQEEVRLYLAPSTDRTVSHHLS